ncbi:hypothetical protein T06_9932 [Trichinella sp. T6]|nr:hypothetical protein T06_9932 [Trichinella sp. T6]
MFHKGICVTRKLEVLLQHSRFFKQIIQYSDITPECSDLSSVIADNLHLVLNRRNNYNLVYEGRAHLLKHTNFDEKQWIPRVNSGCRGAVYTNLEVNTVLRTPHAETGSVDNSILHKFEKMNTLKRCARKETKPVPQIYSEAYRSASTSLEAAGQFPTCKKVKAAMYRSHAKRFPPLLATRQQMEIPVQWRVTKSERQLLLYRNVNNSVSIVCTEENLRELAAHSVWCIDGTFKIVPEFADERGSIDGLEWVRPLEVLTKSSNVETCIRGAHRAREVLLRVFRRKQQRGESVRVFAGHLRRLFLKAFPEMSGSADKNLLQQFKAELSTDTINAAVFRSGTDSFAEAIEFVAQEEHIWRDFTTLKASVSSVKTDADKEATAAPVKTRKEVGKELAELVRQLKELLMTDIPAAAKRAPPQQRMTPDRMPLWNVYHVETRTNNHLEGWHFKMNQQAGKRHLSFYELLRLLIDEQGSTETLIEHVTSGRVTTNHLRVKNNKYEDVQLRIAALTAEYDGGTRTMKQFPKAIAYDFPEPVNF